MACEGGDRRFLILAFAFAFIWVATIFVVIGLCTNYWIEIKERNRFDSDVVVHFGLHRVCWVTADHCNNPRTSYDQQNTLPSVHGLVNTGCFVSVIASLIALVNMYLDRLGRSKTLLSAAAAASATVAGIFLMVGVIVFGTKVEIYTEYITVGTVEYLGYSFGLTACASGMMFIGALLGGVSGCSDARPVFNYSN